MGEPDQKPGRVLGAVLAGGLSSRFGSDKALALLDGRSLLDRAIAMLGAHCDGVAVVGRTVPGQVCLADRPRGGMGPLGGIAAALHHGAAHGYASVLTVAVDSVGIDAEGLALLAPPPACCESQPVIGHWPAGAGAVVDAILAGDGRHSLRALAQALGARMVTFPHAPGNINTPADLAAAQGRDGGEGGGT